MNDPAGARAQCLRLRNDIIDAIHHAGSGHSGGSLSCVEILWTLYWRVMRIKADRPDWPGRDRFVLSKGHAAPALYAVLAARGFFPREELATLRQAGSRLQGHPDMKRLPGVEMSTGSLGMGISVGIGMALAGRLRRRGNGDAASFGAETSCVPVSAPKVHVLVGDGELQEGQNWEALMAAHKFGLSNLVVIVDHNGVQLDGTLDQIMPMGSIADKIASFGWHVKTCDGHDCAALADALRWAGDSPDGPFAIVAKTVKGKGVSFMEGQSAWHGKPITDDEYRKAKAELGGQA